MAYCIIVFFFSYNGRLLYLKNVTVENVLHWSYVMIAVLSWLSFYFLAGPCYNYKSLSDADRESNNETPQYQEVGDNSLPEE